MVNILVVEDKQVQRKNLVKMIKELGEKYNVLEASCAKEALEIANENDIDLFYIDINLPDYSGLKLGYEIRKNSKYELTWIVFVTTFVQYMLQAFSKIHCYDYIIKPYEKSKIQKMTITLTKNLEKEEKHLIKEKKYIILDIAGICVKVNIDEIIFIETFIRTCVIHTINGKYKKSKLSLKKVMEMISDNSFIYSHRSFIININYINKIDKSTSPWIVYFDGYEETVPVGDKYRKDITNALGKLVFIK